MTPASPEVTAAWLRRAVELCHAAREAGSEGLATVLAGRLDDELAASLRGVRASGQLRAAIDAALTAKGIEPRPDVPLERIIQSALRRHALRPWLEALQRR
ncbi:MAG: hypothetical protein ACAI38_23210 [Myxococcota bacterium]